MDLDDETVALYIEESEEHLEGIEDDLLRIEADGASVDKDLVNKVFRAIHSIKGGAGFFGLDRVKELGHDMENVLNMIRNDELVCSAEIIGILLESADLLRQMFDDLANSNDRDLTTVLDKLVSITDNDAQQNQTSQITQATERDETAPEADPPASGERATAVASNPEENLDKQEAGSEAEPPRIVEPETVPADSESPAERAIGTDSKPATDNKLRVSVRLLDQLMTLAGELVLTRNQMSQATAAEDPTRVRQATQRLDQVTSEMQEAIVSTRMQPVGVLFTKFRRVVRDMARNLGKDIDLVIEGEEVELDKTIIEGLSDPLTHLVRNAVDHGIETPDVRSSAGKSQQAALQLRAFHEAGQVIIEVTDDGRGIDPQKMKAKALERELRDPAVLDAMSDAELVKLVFLPGFSTAAELTDISGRGVGMDVVNTNLTQMGGVVDINSAVSVGTTIRIKLPLTLAIIPSLIIGLHSKRYALPQINVQELVRIPAAEVTERIQSIGESQIMRLRGDLLPIVRLGELLNVRPVFTDPVTGELRRDRRRQLGGSRPLTSGTSHDECGEPAERRQSRTSAINVVVVQAGSLRYGLIVDQLLDSEEIVVKPLDDHFQAQKIYAGATIQGDGGVAMILDVVELSRFVELDAVRFDSLESERRRADDPGSQLGPDRHSLLIVKSGATETFAVPLSLVTRIEKIERRQIEFSGDSRTMIYRQGSLFLFTVDDAAQVDPLLDTDEAYVIVFQANKREVGLVVSSIEDTVKVGVEFDRETFRQPGIFGSAIIGERTTLLIDLLGIVEAVRPDWIRRAAGADRQTGPANTILLAEDSRFFLDHLSSFLKDEGYNVLTAMDGREGLEQLDAHADEVSLVMTDIEMPVMDGLVFTKKIRSNERLRNLPIIAVTSLAGDVDKARGFEAGVNDYLIKLDKEEILNCLDKYLKEAA